MVGILGAFYCGIRNTERGFRQLSAIRFTTGNRGDQLRYKDSHYSALSKAIDQVAENYDNRSIKYSDNRRARFFGL